MDTLEWRYSLSAMPWCSGPCGQRKKVPTSLTLPHHRTQTVSLPSSQGSLEMASVKQYGGRDPVCLLEQVLKIMLLLCNPLKPVYAVRKPRVDTPLNLREPCFKPSSPGNTCLGEEETRSPALGQPGHSNLSK